MNYYYLKTPFDESEDNRIFNETFLNDISRQLDDPLTRGEEPYFDDQLTLLFVPSGGTEFQFPAIVENAQTPIVLLTTGRANSLAAAMEMLSYAKQRGRHGEVLHGSAAAIAARLALLTRVNRALVNFKQMRFGIVGQPSDWLIGSHVDYREVSEKHGCQFIELTLDDLYKHYHTDQSDDMSKSLAIYGALEKLVAEHRLNGLTLRCFDLLDSLQATGCLALSKLNDAGIIAGCEGDVPSMLSMAILSSLSQSATFMANPSRLDVAAGQVVFAHCTVPSAMVEKTHLTTHYESGIGVAIKGEFAPSEVTIFKVAADLNRYFVARGQLVENLYEADLCRTQIVVDCPDCVESFTREPLGNHHIIVGGDHVAAVEQLMAWLR